MKCTCNKAITQGSDFDCRYLLRNLTAEAYNFSSVVSKYERDMKFVRMIETRSEERGARRFFRLGNIWFCKDTASRILGVSSRQYKKCLHGSQVVADLFLRDYLEGRKKPRKPKEVDRYLIAFFGGVVKEGKEYTKRGLYTQFLEEQGWQYEVDDQGSHELVFCKDGPPLPACS